MRDAGTYFVIVAVSCVVLAGTALRAASLLLVVLVCVAGFFASGAEALAWLWFVIALPALSAAACFGWILRAVLRTQAWVPSTAVALVALGIACVLLAQRASLDPVPARAARQLPTFTSTLSAFCFDEVPASERRTARRQLQALARGLQAYPDSLVKVEYVLAESPGTRLEDRTVRELATETLDSNSCDSPEATALRRALAAAD